MTGDLRAFIQSRLEYQRWAAQNLREAAAPYRSPKIADGWMATAEQAQNVLNQHRPRRLQVASLNGERGRCQCGEPDWCSTLRTLAMEWVSCAEYREHAEEWRPMPSASAPS